VARWRIDVGGDELWKGGMGGVEDLVGGGDREGW